MPKKQITDTRYKAQKYIIHKLFPEARSKISQVLNELTERLESVHDLIVQLEKLNENLAISIESIEDFGGVLLGYEAPHEFVENDGAKNKILSLTEIEAENDLLIQGIDMLCGLQSKWKDLDIELANKSNA